MKVSVKKVYGYEGAMRSLYMSKGHLSEELEEEIDDICNVALDRNGRFITEYGDDAYVDVVKAARFDEIMQKV